MVIKARGKSDRLLVVAKMPIGHAVREGMLYTDETDWYNGTRKLT